MIQSLGTRTLYAPPLPPAARGEIEVTVLMPCLNEAETLERCISKAMRALEDGGFTGEVVIGDNGSTDGSQAIAERLGARVIHAAVKGYGAALQTGISGARGRFVIMADSDDSYDFSQIAPFIQKLRQGYDLVMGNRFQGSIAPGAMPRLHRYLGNPVLTAIGQMLFHSPCGDFHCGLRGFRRDAIVGLNLRTTGMEFASEMVVQATLHQLRIAEVPITLSKDGRTRPPHLRSWRDGWRHLRFLLMYSPRYLFLVPGLALMLAGTAVSVALLPGPLTVGRVTLDVNTLLFAGAAVILGAQAILFSLFAKVFAITEGLLRPDPRLERMFRYVTLESGLIAGAAAFVAGLGLSVASLHAWRATGFGPLDPARSLRQVIPAALMMILGAQVIFSSFFLSILGLRRR
jgi:hypothetical protein